MVAAIEIQAERSEKVVFSRKRVTRGLYGQMPSVLYTYTWDFESSESLMEPIAVRLGSR